MLLIGVQVLSQERAPILEHGLTLERIGNGYWKQDRSFGFRVYSIPDGARAQVQYWAFASRAEAKQYLKTCLRPAAKIIYRQEKRDTSGNLVGERIVAVARVSGKKEFALIRGVRLNYYFIGSSSLGAAIQVEELIQER